MIFRHRLGNGLRIVLSPMPGVGIASVAVVYGVGFRDERPGQQGFAHLFEHLMSQGSRSLGKLEHKRLIDAAGGFTYATTRADFTDYLTTLPAAAVELSLFCEADRMAALALTRQNMDNQIRVVTEEIKLNVLDAPYGAFPWFSLPPLLYGRFENTHDAYGDFAALHAATVDDATAFHALHYQPGNAVLAVAGDIEPSQVLDWAERYFGSLPSAARSAPRDLSEPVLPPRRSVTVARRAPSPAVSLGYRVPDPGSDFAAYLRTFLIGRILGHGSGSLLHRALVTPGLARAVTVEQGHLGDMLGGFGPTLLALSCYLTGVAAEPELLLDAVGKALAEDLDSALVRRACAQLRGGFARVRHDTDWLAGRTGVLELLHGRPSLVDEVDAIVAGTTPRELSDLARAVLLAGPPAVAMIVPEAGSQTVPKTWSQAVPEAGPRTGPGAAG